MTAPASSNLLLQIASPAARALILAAAAGLGLVAFRVKATSVRLFTWTAVLCAALAMPLLGWILPPLPVPAPALMQPLLPPLSQKESPRENYPLTVQATHASANTLLQPSGLSAPEQRQNATLGASCGEPSGREANADVHAWSSAPASNALANQALPSPPAAAPLLSSAIGWTWIHGSFVALCLYLAIASLLLLRFAAGFFFARRLMRSSQIVSDPRLTLKLGALAHAFNLQSIPRAAESEFISVPVTMGVLRPAILLPADWQEWDDPKLHSVIAHEVSHVARRDALTQRLSLLHRALFWFSPLAWWLDRHLASLAEQASDEAALSTGADRSHYARTLLGFFQALQTASGRVRWQGVAMAKAGHSEQKLAEQRLERILSWKGSVAMRPQKSIAIVVFALAVPAVYLTASVHAANPEQPQAAQLAQNQAPPTTAPAPTAEPSAPPEPAPASEPTPAPAESSPSAEPARAPAATSGTIPGQIAGAVPPKLPLVYATPQTAARGFAAVAPVAKFAATPGLPPSYSSRIQSSGLPASYTGSSYRYGYDDEQRFVIVSGKTDAFTMSGLTEDAVHVQKLKKSIPGDFIWFQQDEKSYVIRDQATVDRARSFWAPQEELGKKQEELGKQQQALGKQQEAIGAKMEQVRVSVPDMTAELEKLKSELKQLGSGATMEQIGHVQSEIGELQSKIGSLQSQAGAQQGELGSQMGALGEKQGELGRQQGDLGRRQAELAHEASRQMKQLLDDAIKKGTAQPEL